MRKLGRIVLSIIITLITITMIGMFNTINAESSSPIYLGIVSLRSSGYGYKQGGKQVWKIAQYDSEVDTTADLSKTIYCIKAGPGFGSTDMSTGGVQKISTYNQKFNLRNLESIGNPYNTVLPSGENYNKLIWLLDHFYIIPTTDNTEDREEFLRNIIPNDRYELLTNDDIDVIQQLAIWYFTNPGSEYQYDSIELYRNSLVNVDSDYKTFEDLLGDDGWDRQDAVSSLYDYYITNADGSYTSTNPTTTPIEFVKDNATMQTIGDNYVAGPYTINQILDVNFEISATYTDMNDSPITPSLAIRNSDGNIEETSQTLKELIGKEFYLMMPTSSNITGIKMTVSTSYTARTLTYWSAENAPNTEQPVVIIDETPYNFSDETSIVVPRPFDLSLRKYITEVNGVGVESREPDVDVSSLRAGTDTTATYNHTKTPIKVAVGDVVTYTIRVYNEGSQNGYVSQITDHLPEQLEFIVDDPINIQYGWRLASSSDLKTVTTNYLSKENETSDGENLINAFDGNELAYKDVQIKCRVVSTEPMPNKITNIAEITGFTDENGNTVTDRDSQAGNVTLPTGTDLENYKDAEINRGEEYIPGQQDDDDFEKLILKEFDLSLRKFITGLNGTAITNREPNVDLTTLRAGTSTTAIYNHTKTPIKVTIGDEVEYTIRVYNEGEVDGYVSQITDHLPAQLEFIADNEINRQYGWTQDETNSKIIRTNYLSKDNETEANANKIVAFDGTTLSYKEIKVVCRVISTEPMPTKITNIADISGFTDGNGNTVTDRDSQENNVQIPEDLPGYKDDEINKNYVPGQQDDDDFEKLMIKEFDLSLRKFITGVNDEEITNREPDVDLTGLISGTSTTATYNHTKAPVAIEIGDTVIYTIRVYNEGDVAGYASQITDHLPEQLEFIPDNQINIQYGWVQDSSDSKIIRTNYLSQENEETPGENLIVEFNGTNLSYKDVQIACRVVSTEPMPNKITNIAEISDFTNANGEAVTDRDSEENNVQIPEDLPGYKDDEISKDYIPGQQDDDDFEKLTLKSFDLALRKFITKVNDTNITSRIPQVDVSGLRDGSSTTAIYNHSKEPVEVTIGAVVEYTIRVYNEGQIAGYAQEITDHIPDQLEFLPDNETNQEYGWVMLDEAGNQTQTVEDAVSIRTNYLSQENEQTTGENEISAFDGTTLSYKDVKVAFRVVTTDPMPEKITNIADITDFTDDSGNKVPDRDSEENNVQIPEDLPGYKDDEINNDYVPGQQDDDDFEKVTIVEFDLSLRKFITAVNETEITNREPAVDVTPIIDGSSSTAIYNHPKDPVLVSNGNIVTYTIRVYNEGEVAGYASRIKDDIPVGLEFLPDNETNQEYRWVMLDEEGNITEKADKAVSIETDYLSKEQEQTEGENLLEAFNGEELDYKDVKVAFRVTEPNTSDRIIINQAQISEDTDKDGNDVEDKDSTPDEWNEGEDDQDIEKVKVQYFDLSLRKWVTQAIVNKNGEETIIDTGHKAEDDPEDIVLVDLKDSEIATTTVKFRYSIRVTNEGNIAGYAKEVKDYIPEGLIFVAEDNPLWTQVDDRTIVTTQTENTLLEPGESTEVEVILTWDKVAQNFGVMDNWAEISKDDNDFDSPDIDSTPDNNVHGEDDIDDAPVMVTVKTGQVVMYIAISMTVLIAISGGIILIKKYVL